MAAVAAFAGAKGVDPKTLPPIEVPPELEHKLRVGMSAKSGYGKFRGRRQRTVRLGRATGQFSYDVASPQDLIRERRAIRRRETEAG